MNMKDVKEITIPEGNVKRILINGIVAWEVPTSKVLVSISTSGQTTSWYTGQTFSYNGTCTATYSDGTTAVVTPTASSPSMSSAGTKTVTLTYTEDGVTVTTTYNITVRYDTYTLKYYYNGMGNGAGRMRVNYTKADGTTAWGTTTTKTSYQSSTITVTAAKNTAVKVQIYNDTSYTTSFKIKQTKNGSSTQLTSQSISANSNKTWTSGNLNPGTDNTLTLRVEY